MLADVSRYAVYAMQQSKSGTVLSYTCSFLWYTESVHHNPYSSAYTTFLIVIQICLI